LINSDVQEEDSEEINILIGKHESIGLLSKKESRFDIEEDHLEDVNKTLLESKVEHLESMLKEKDCYVKKLK